MDHWRQYIGRQQRHREAERLNVPISSICPVWDLGAHGLRTASCLGSLQSRTQETGDKNPFCTWELCCGLDIILMYPEFMWQSSTLTVRQERDTEGGVLGGGQDL
jgi:hypothetical protein